nr:MAG TPA: hypothetical protein [Caudoviricetes sp.]
MCKVQKIPRMSRRARRRPARFGNETSVVF